MILKRKSDKTNRSYKVSEVVKKAVSRVLVRNELPLDTPFKFPINVIKVEMNSDLKIAYIYVVCHEEIEKKEIINRLNSCKKYLSKEVANFIDLKYSPKLVFRNDKSIYGFSRIEQILNSEKVQDDIKKTDL